MDMDQIEAFISVATLGGFTPASRHLHRTQPAISRRVKALERTLGVELFARENKEVHLTPEGRQFLPYAESSMAELKRGMEAISSARNTLPLRVAIVGTLADQHLTSALIEFRQTGAEIELRTATSQEVSALVGRGEADLGIRYFEDFAPHVSCVPIGFERLRLICSPSHNLAGRSVKQGRSLASERWIGFPCDSRVPDSFGHLLIRSLLNIGIIEPAITQVDSLTAQKRLIQAGYGIALLPMTSCEEELSTGSLAEISVSKLKAEQPVFGVFKPHSRRIDQARQLLALIRSNFRSGSR